MKQRLLIALLGMALTAPLLAHAEGAYVGVNAGSSDQKYTVNNSGLGSHSETAYKLYGGYDFNQNVGVEIGYADFGRANAVYNGVAINAKPTASYVAAVGTLPLNEQFAVFAKAGASFNHIDANGANGNVGQNRTTALLGIGASYSFNKNLALVAEYEDFGKTADDAFGDSAKVNLLSVGVRYKF